MPEQLSPYVRLQELTNQSHSSLSAASRLYASRITGATEAEIRFQLDGLTPLTSALVDAIALELDFEDGGEWLFEFLSGDRVNGTDPLAHLYRVRELVASGITLRRVSTER